MKKKFYISILFTFPLIYSSQSESEWHYRDPKQQEKKNNTILSRAQYFGLVEPKTLHDGNQKITDGYKKNLRRKNTLLFRAKKLGLVDNKKLQKVHL